MTAIIIRPPLNVSGVSANTAEPPALAPLPATPLPPASLDEPGRTLVASSATHPMGGSVTQLLAPSPASATLSALIEEVRQIADKFQEDDSEERQDLGVQAETLVEKIRGETIFTEERQALYLKETLQTLQTVAKRRLAVKEARRALECLSAKLFDEGTRLKAERDMRETEPPATKPQTTPLPDIITYRTVPPQLETRIGEVRAYLSAVASRTYNHKKPAWEAMLLLFNGLVREVCTPGKIPEENVPTALENILLLVPIDSLREYNFPRLRQDLVALRNNDYQRSAVATPVISSSTTRETRGLTHRINPEDLNISSE